MPNAGAMPLVTKELSRKNAEYTPATEKRKNFGMPTHRELNGTYHRLEIGDKRNLAQTTIKKALEQADITSILDDSVEKYPKITKNFSDTPETDTPQVFTKKGDGDREFTVYIRLNNGDEDNTMVVFNTKVGKGGALSDSLSEGLFHITTQKNLDKARRSPFSRVHWSKEGAWLRGGKGGTAEKYINKFEKKKEKTLNSFWKEKDNKRTRGLGGNKREIKMMEAEQALEMWEKKNLQEGFIKIWSQENEVREKWRKKVEEARRWDAEISNNVYVKLDKLDALGAQLPGLLGAQVKKTGKSVLEKGKNKALEAAAKVDWDEFWEKIGESVTFAERVGPW